MTCNWCELSEEEKKYLLFQSQYWSVYLANEQDYIGRCILVCNRHCASLSELTIEEWGELGEIVKKTELCMKNVLGAEMCNWSCLMSSFYKNEILVQTVLKGLESRNISGYYAADKEEVKKVLEVIRSGRAVVMSSLPECTQNWSDSGGRRRGLQLY